MRVSSFINTIVNGLIGAANLLGLSDVADRVAADISKKWFKRNEVTPKEMTEVLGKLTAAARAKGDVAMSKLTDRLAQLKMINTSPAVSSVIADSVKRLESQVKDKQQQINLANAYESANNELINTVGNMGKFDRTTNKAEEIFNQAKDNANKINEIYSNIEKEVK